MDRLVRRASSVLGCPLDSVEVVGNGRMMAKLSSMLNNMSHPLQDTLAALGSSFSERLLHPRCAKESSHDSLAFSCLSAWSRPCLSPTILSCLLPGKPNCLLFLTSPVDGFARSPLPSESSSACLYNPDNKVGIEDMPWLLTPLTNPQTPQGVLFNQMHARSRSTIERTIGMLKGRWMCLDTEPQPREDVRPDAMMGPDCRHAVHVRARLIARL
ncbi:hypothetical protein D4764_04G0012680 [Takifugu flavidus]|uniref:DDE Tnp4 domain-containing protein n=1 Tax=Takifugu flavidus TaxID=433684 RepID=A0A5C6N8K3_9TELE|nr:hypothetical protein D4764_04G0012680 [Takifugu flavidus]